MANDERGRLALGRFTEFFKGGGVALEDLGTIEQVMRRISTDRELGGDQYARTFRAGPSVRIQDQRAIVLKRADDRIELGDRDAHGDLPPATA